MNDLPNTVTDETQVPAPIEDGQADPAASEARDMSESKPVKITVSEPDTGKVIEEKVVSNNYMVVCAGNRYVSGVQIMGKPGRATHIVTIKVEPPNAGGSK